MRGRGALRAVAGAFVALALLAAGCGGGGSGTRSYTAEFERAIQVFPGVNVRVLGVDVGRVTGVKAVPGGVEVTFQVDRDDVKIPADVEAAVVPTSLLGERYIQLFPAYEGGPTLEDGAVIPVSRTAVPSEPDELLRALQDYLGGLDPETVSEFVSTAADTLDGNGEELNRLIGNAARTMDLLSDKREDLATIVVELNKLTLALASRQEKIGQLIRDYNAVAHVLTDNRAALEGTVTGLNEAALELASLLIEHRKPLGKDIEALARTGRTVERNVESLARTGEWAKLLFSAASRAVDYDHDWLRLGNQGQELAALILMRLEQRLIELCAAAGATECANSEFWQGEVPELFCFVPEICELGAAASAGGSGSGSGGGGGGGSASSGSGSGSAAAASSGGGSSGGGSSGAGSEASASAVGERDQVEALTAAIEAIPEVRRELVLRTAEVECAQALDPDRCILRHLRDEAAIQDIVSALLEATLGNPMRWAGALSI